MKVYLNIIEGNNGNDQRVHFSEAEAFNEIWELHTSDKLHRYEGTRVITKEGEEEIDLTDAVSDQEIENQNWKSHCDSFRQSY